MLPYLKGLFSLKHMTKQLLTFSFHLGELILMSFVEFKLSICFVATVNWIPMICREWTPNKQYGNILIMFNFINDLMYAALIFYANSIKQVKRFAFY